MTRVDGRPRGRGFPQPRPLLVRAPWSSQRRSVRPSVLPSARPSCLPPPLPCRVFAHGQAADGGLNTTPKLSHWPLHRRPPSCARSHERESWRPESQTGRGTGAGKFGFLSLLFDRENNNKKGWINRAIVTIDGKPWINWCNAAICPFACNWFIRRLVNKPLVNGILSEMVFVWSYSGFQVNSCLYYLAPYNSPYDSWGASQRQDV